VFGQQVPVSLYGLELQAHIYFSPTRRAYEISEITNRIERLKKELDLINKPKHVSKRYRDYFSIDEISKNSFTYTLNETKINEMISRAGYFILLSYTKDLNSKETLELYRNKDIIEKNFCQFKNDLDFSRLKTHLNETSNGKLFVGFIALIMRSYMSRLIRNNSELKKYTFEKVMRELKKIKKVTMSDGQELLLPLTKTQKEILINLKVDEYKL